MSATAVDRIIEFNRGFHRASLARKIDKMAESPFSFFRATFHLFAHDLIAGGFRKWPASKAAGQIVGDLHTENFGAFRAVTNEIVYGINDFDDAAPGPYEFDLRRLGVSLVLSAIDNGHTMAEGVMAAEDMASAYLDSIGKWSGLKRRRDFESLAEPKAVRQLLVAAGEVSRVAFLKGLARRTKDGGYQLVHSARHQPVDAKQRASLAAALPEFARNLAMPAERRGPLEILDAAFRYAGAGSLGRNRFVLLIGKGAATAPKTRTPKPADYAWSDLRLIEWKDARDSALLSRRPKAGRRRAREVVEAALEFQAFPKRYLGWTEVDGAPTQGRELGANDRRFDYKLFAALDRFRAAAQAFGAFAARAHLMASLDGRAGPREMLEEFRGREQRLAGRLVAFSAAYAERVFDDHAEFARRIAEVERKWKTRRSAAATDAAN